MGAGERAMSYGWDTGNLETSWPVRVSQTRTWESSGDQHAENFPSGEYTGEYTDEYTGEYTDDRQIHT